MKSRPILFSAPMVRALFAGTKTQTRRTVKKQPPPWTETVRRLHDASSIYVGHGWQAETPMDKRRESWRDACPYGAPGDTLWVREEHYRFGHWEPIAGVRTKGGRQKWKFVAETAEVRYNDNAPESFRKGRHHKDPTTPAWHKRLARFMPRALSRLTLEITAVRVERLQGISEADCWAEGIEACDGILENTAIFDCAKRMGRSYEDAAPTYAALWESINGEKPEACWSANPWVWVVEFKRVTT